LLYISQVWMAVQMWIYERVQSRQTYFMQTV
jgi:hypothetical protein